jgi:hypothetical protein
MRQSIWIDPLKTVVNATICKVLYFAFLENLTSIYCKLVCKFIEIYFNVFWYLFFKLRFCYFTFGADNNLTVFKLHKHNAF